MYFIEPTFGSPAPIFKPNIFVFAAGFRHRTNFPSHGHPVRPRQARVLPLQRVQVHQAGQTRVRGGVQADTQVTSSCQSKWHSLIFASLPFTLFLSFDCEVLWLYFCE